MYVYLSKILPIFVMSLSLALIFALAALVLLRGKRKKLAAAFIVAVMAVLWVAATPIVAEGLYRNLESRYPPLPLAEIPTAGCIVVLGGVVSPPLAPCVDLELSEAVDRVYKAAQLYRAGKAPIIVATAGNQPSSLSPWVEADLIRDVLMEWGVPKDAEGSNS